MGQFFTERQNLRLSQFKAIADNMIYDSKIEIWQGKDGEIGENASDQYILSLSTMCSKKLSLSGLKSSKPLQTTYYTSTKNRNLPLFEKGRKYCRGKGYRYSHFFPQRFQKTFF